jgi:hypothetical protein
MKEKNILAGAEGPWALNQEWKVESGQLLGSGAGKDLYRMKGRRPSNEGVLPFFNPDFLHRIKILSRH